MNPVYFKHSPVMAKLLRKITGQYKAGFQKGVRPEMMVIQVSKGKFYEYSETLPQKHSPIGFPSGK